MLINLLAETVTSSSSSSGTATQNNPLMTWIFVGVLAVVLIVYFIFSSRSRKKQQEQYEEKMSKLQKGDKIKTIGMIVCEIVEVREDGTYLVMSGEGDCFSYFVIDRQAIYQVIEPVATENSEQTDEVFAENGDTTETAGTEAVEASKETKSDEKTASESDEDTATKVVEENTTEETK